MRSQAASEGQVRHDVRARPGAQPLPPAQVSRRGFLGLLGSGASLAALARLPLASAAGATPSAAAAPGFFGAAEREILTAVVERMVETGDPAAPDLEETRALETIERLCAGLDPALTRPLPALLRLVEWGPWIFEARAARFTELDLEARDASLRGWMQSRFALRRAGFLALRNLAFLGYWSHDASWPLIGYDGPLIARRAAG